MTFRFSGVLLRFVNFQKEIPIDASTLASGLEQLVTREPQLKNVLFDDAGVVRATHRMFLNGEQLERDAVAAEVKPTDTVEILTAIAGG